MTDITNLSDEELLAMRKTPEEAGVDITDDWGIIAQGLAGTAKGLHNVYRHTSNLLGGVSDAEINRFDEINSRILQQTPAKVGEFVGEVLGTAPVGAGAAAGTAGLISAVAPRMAAAAGPILQAFGRGAVEGGVASTMVGESPTAGAGIGGVASAAFPTAGRLWKGAARPAVPSAAALRVERLGEQQGVPIGLTAGQLVSDKNITGGLIKGVENTINRIPGAGAILDAQQSAMAKWNLAELRAAMPLGLGDNITTAGTRGLEQARNTINRAYDDALGDLQQGDMLIDDVSLDAIAGIEKSAVDRIGPSKVGDVQRDIGNVLDDLYAGRLDGSNVKLLEKDLRVKAEAAARVGDGDVADAYRELLGVVRNVRDTAIGPDRAARLQEVDAAYSRLSPIRDAAAMKGAVMNDFFTPSQLATGGQKGRGAWGKATARNPAVGRAKSADEVFGSTIPRMGPGTAEKMFTQSLLGGAAGVAGDLASGGSGGLAQSGLLGAATAPVLGQLMPFLRDPIVGRTGVQGAMRGMQDPLDEILRTIRKFSVTPSVLAGQE